MEYFVLFGLEAARIALNAVLQWPMRSRFAIHSQVIVVSALSLSAIRPFALSPLARSCSARISTEL